MRYTCGVALLIKHTGQPIGKAAPYALAKRRLQHRSIPKDWRKCKVAIASGGKMERQEVPLIDEDLIVERRNPAMGGVQRIYRFKNGYGLSLINGPLAHYYPYAWEAAVLKNVSQKGYRFEITYDTPLTDDVVILPSNEETNAFIHHAKWILEGL